MAAGTPEGVKYVTRLCARRKRIFSGWFSRPAPPIRAYSPLATCAERRCVYSYTPHTGNKILVKNKHFLQKSDSETRMPANSITERNLISFCTTWPILIYLQIHNEASEWYEHPAKYKNPFGGVKRFRSPWRNVGLHKPSDATLSLQVSLRLGRNSQRSFREFKLESETAEGKTTFSDDAHFVYPPA